MRNESLYENLKVLESMVKYIIYENLDKKEEAKLKKKFHNIIKKLERSL